MNTKLAIFIFLLSMSFSSVAQNLATAERAPRLPIENYLPDKDRLVYMGFIHSSSIPCKVSTANTIKIIESIPILDMIFFTREQFINCEKWVKDLNTQYNCMHYAANDIFQRYGVDYAPFGVLLDSKRRVLWFGHPRSLTKVRIENIITKWNTQK
ncbi:MAG: hypothetical protein IIW52_08925 [Alistipes sp.]|nr:hypothetical protein [Alistipes sp.]